MKQIYTAITLISFIVSLNSCSSKSNTSSPQKPHFSVSGQKNNKDNGYLQRHLDNWLQNSWNPSVKDVEKKYQKDENSRSFTLQEFVEKAEVYNNIHPDSNNSHVEKLNKLPVIGK